MALADKPASQSDSTCGVCDKGPSVRCPSCPKRAMEDTKPQDFGFRKAMGRDPELTKLQVRSARAAQQLAHTREDHPAYPHLERAYQDVGCELANLIAKRRGLSAMYTDEQKGAA